MPSNTGEAAMDELKDLSLAQGVDGDGKRTIILPIFRGTTQWEEAETSVHGSENFPPSKVTLSQDFPIEPAFAVTTHKSQRLTLQAARAIVTT